MSVAAQGMKKLFNARLLALIGSVLLILTRIPGIHTVSQAVFGLGSLIAILAGAILEVIALKLAAPADPGYKSAYSLAIGALLACGLAIVLDIVFKGKGMDNAWIYKIVGLFTVYFVVTATIRFLKAGDNDKEIRFGRMTMNAVIIGYLGLSLLELFRVITRTPADNIGYVIGVLVISVISAVSEVLYVMFLGKAWKKI